MKKLLVLVLAVLFACSGAFAKAKVLYTAEVGQWRIEVMDAKCVNEKVLLGAIASGAAPEQAMVMKEATVTGEDKKPIAACVYVYEGEGANGEKAGIIVDEKGDAGVIELVKKD